jgi:hypothetical protein
LKISEINVNKIQKSPINVRGFGDMDIKVGKEAHDEERGGEIWDEKTGKWITHAQIEREFQINNAILKAAGSSQTMNHSASTIEQARVAAWAEDLPPEMIDLMAPVIPETYYSKLMRDMIYYWAETPKILFELHWMFMNFPSSDKSDLIKR